jgi:hypothetical protein
LQKITVLIFAGFSIPLLKVNYDGPSLQLRAGFSSSLSTSNSAFHEIEAFETQGKALIVFCWNHCLIERQRAHSATE